MLKIEEIKDNEGYWTVKKSFCEVYLDVVYKQTSPREDSIVNPSLKKRAFIKGIKKMLSNYHREELINHFIWENIMKEFPNV